MLALLAVSCSEIPDYKKEVEENKDVFNRGIQTVMQDSCEYILFIPSNSGCALVHKQNCKYCEIRNTK
jgi:hypothetical protein